MRNLMLIMKRLHICRLGKTFAAVLIILVLLTTYPKDVLFAQQSSSDSPVVTTSATPPHLTRMIFRPANSMRLGMASI